MPIPNADGKILLENFVEDRNIAEMGIDSMKDAPPGMGKGQYFFKGHKGLISLNEDEPLSNVTLVRETYVPLKTHPERLVGVRTEWKTKLLTGKVLKNLTVPENPAPDKTDFRSVTAITHNLEGFVSQEQPSTRPHNYVTEQPVTFWTDNKAKLAGVSLYKRPTSPFRKNSSFSTPTADSWESPKPYEMPRFPNM